MRLASDDSQGTPAATDPGVAALLRRAANVQQLPVSEHNPHYVQLLNELTVELDAEPTASDANVHQDQS